MSVSHPKTCEYVNLYGKRDFAGVNKLRKFGVGEIILDYQGGPNVITGSL